MTTLVVSDLHLGARSASDLLRRPELLGELLEAVRGVTRLVLLGDVLELRDGPAHEALAVAEPVFRGLGEALPDGAEVLMTPGNHDHALIAPWLEARRRRPAAPALALDERVPAAQASPLAALLASWLKPRDLTVRYPGVWLRDDVYAMHGHYMDLHITVPSFERLAGRTVQRFVRRGAAQAGPVDGYEASLAPVYAGLYALAQSSPDRGRNLVSGASGRAWKVLVGTGGRRPLGHVALGSIGFPATIWALNRAGLGPLSGNLSGVELRRAGLRGAGELTRGLGLSGTPYVLYGHTHRGGPWPGDVLDEWTAAGGTRLLNPGSWVYESLFMGPRPERNPYWPGNAVEVPASGPPRLRAILGPRPVEDIRPPADQG